MERWPLNEALARCSKGALKELFKLPFVSMDGFKAAWALQSPASQTIVKEGLEEEEDAEVNSFLVDLM